MNYPTFMDKRKDLLTIFEELQRKYIDQVDEKSRFAILNHLDTGKFYFRRPKGCDCGPNKCGECRCMVPEVPCDKCMDECKCVVREVPCNKCRNECKCKVREVPCNKSCCCLCDTNANKSATAALI